MRKTNYEKLGALMTERKFLPKDLNISSRQINYWKGKLVLPFFTNEKKRGYMSFSEAFWMLIVNELSNVGINSKKIETLSENIWVIPMKEKYADKVFKEHLKNNKDYLTEEEREAIKSFLNNDMLMHDLFRKSTNPFTDTLKKSLIDKEVYSFYYFPKNESYLFSSSGHKYIGEINNLYYEETAIVIPYLPLLKLLLGLDLEFDKNKLDLEYLSYIENQIRRLLIFDKPKFIELELHQDNKVKIYKITESHKKAEELADFILESNLPEGAKLEIHKRSQDNYKVTIKT
jgi:hypothetical protein